jgi:type III restriction enzyme
MKFHFEPNLDYQLQAIEAVCDLFRGQEICRTEFTVTKNAVDGVLLPGMESDLGIGNRLTNADLGPVRPAEALPCCQPQ